MSHAADSDERVDSSSETVAESDEGPPRGPLVLFCSLLVTVPTLLLLGICTYLAFSLMIFGVDKETPPMTMLAVVVFPVPLLLVLFFEHAAVVRRSAGAALMVGLLFLFLLVPGIASLSGGIKGLTGMTDPHPDYPDWSRVAAVAGCLAVTALIGLVHLRWWWCLMRCGAEAMDAEEPTTP